MFWEEAACTALPSGLVSLSLSCDRCCTVGSFLNKQNPLQTNLCLCKNKGCPGSVDSAFFLVVTEQVSCSWRYKGLSS